MSGDPLEYELRILERNARVPEIRPEALLRIEERIAELRQLLRERTV